jgi:DNA-binding PadR family transcriptional regulator
MYLTRDISPIIFEGDISRYIGKEVIMGREDWFRGWHGFQAKRGDMSPILLRVLAEKPMHGYEIIRELEQKSHGLWRPSPGSVYPTLQLLEEQDLVESRDEGGKKVYTITDEGRSQAKSSKARGPWECRDDKHDMEQVMEVRGSILEFIGTMRQLMRGGTADQQERAIAVIKEAKSKLDSILGEETQAKP